MRIRFPRTVLIVAFTALCTASLWSEKQEELKTYLPDYRMKQFFPGDINRQTRFYDMAPYSRIENWRQELELPVDYTHSSGELLLGSFDEVIYFSLNVEEEALAFPSPEQKAQLTYLQRLAGRSRLTLALNGSSNGFVPLVRDEEQLNLFFENLSRQMDLYDLNGIDLDWEFPRNEEEKEIHLAFLKRLRSFCDGRSARLSMAVSRFRSLTDESYTLPDSIHLMSYDFYGRHSTAASTREALEYMALRHNIPMDKILMGIPFYGRIYSGDSPDYWKKAKSYRLITMENQVDPEDNEADGFFFNGPELVAAKADMAEELGTAGCFIWEIGQDRLNGNSLSSVLFNRIRRPQ